MVYMEYGQRSGRMVLNLIIGEVGYHINLMVKSKLMQERIIHLNYFLWIFKYSSKACLVECQTLPIFTSPSTPCRARKLKYS